MFGLVCIETNQFRLLRLGMYWPPNTYQYKMFVLEEPLLGLGMYYVLVCIGVYWRVLACIVYVLIHICIGMYCMYCLYWCVLFGLVVSSVLFVLFGLVCIVCIVRIICICLYLFVLVCIGMYCLECMYCLYRLDWHVLFGLACIVCIEYICLYW